MIIKYLFITFIAAMSVLPFNQDRVCAAEVVAPSTEEDQPQMRPADSDPKFWEKAKEGYYWYKDPPKEDAKKTEKPQRKLPSLKDFSKQQLWDMHPDDFKKVEEDFRKKAIQTLEPAHVKEYMAIVDIARRKSLAYTSVQQYVLKNSPQYNTTRDEPKMNPARNVAQRTADEAIAQRVRTGANDYGLMYFYSPSCPYCVEQSKILEMFRKKHSWDIKPINIDNAPAMAAQFKVQTTPTLVMVYRYHKEAVPVCVGMCTLTDMEAGIYRGMRIMAGEVDPKQYFMHEHQRGGTLDPSHIPDFE